MTAIIALVVSLLTLAVVTRMGARQRHEYNFFLAEYTGKTGKPVTWRQKANAWNGAMGGRAPSWHWVAPVISTSESIPVEWQKAFLERNPNHGL